MSTTIYENVTKTIIEALERGVVPWKKPWHQLQSVPTNATTNRPYRGVNTFLLSIHPYTDHRWLTLKQANELGGAVKPGEKATTVVFWKRWKPNVPDEEQESGVTREVPLLRYFKVFNAEQCVGLSLPELHQSEEYKEHERIERAELLVQHMPSPPTIHEGGDTAWYRPSDDHVQIPELKRFRTPDAYYATLFHELGHATGHESRLKRSGVTGTILFGSGEYSKEELVAELTSASVSAHIVTPDRSRPVSVRFGSCCLNALSQRFRITFAPKLASYGGVIGIFCRVYSLAREICLYLGASPTESQIGTLLSRCILPSSAVHVGVFCESNKDTEASMRAHRPC